MSLSPAPGTQLEELLAVQALDTDLDRHRHLRDTLPERAELVAIDNDLADLSQRLVVARAERDAVAEAQEAMEKTLAGVESRAREVKKRLYGGTVSATRELQAMAAEVDSLTARASELESRVLEGMEVWEPLDSRVDTLEGERVARLAARADVVARLAAREREVDVEIAELGAAREAAVAGIAPQLLSTYDRLRRHLGGVGISRLAGSRCGGCHLSLSATELDHLRHQPVGTVSYCEQCGRILAPSR